MARSDGKSEEMRWKDRDAGDCMLPFLIILHQYICLYNFGHLGREKGGIDGTVLSINNIHVSRLATLKLLQREEKKLPTFDG